MNDLIEDLLLLARVGQAHLRRIPTDISEIGAEIADELRESDPARKVSFNIQPGMHASCDPGLIRIVLQNLLGNSWKFSSKTPEPRIQLGARRQNGKPVFFVADNGAGFPMEQAASVFAPFKRLHSESEFPGTGIGLATVQRIIRKHDGTIWAESEPGRGATFFFTL
jgi:light-regulated signal transduction histidine kinase (bacteriophytochrome)